jgi:hypothetical protein
LTLTLHSKKNIKIQKIRYIKKENIFGQGDQSVKKERQWGTKVILGCLETKQLGGKRQIILSINNEGISHIKREGN